MYFGESTTGGVVLFLHEIATDNSAKTAKYVFFMGEIFDLLVNIAILFINIKFIFLSLRSQIYG
jgi:hypothetical protein